MSDKPPRDQFLESLHRCSTQEKFIPAFYQRFLATSEEVRWKFRMTDFSKQNDMLLNSLKLAAGAAAGEPESLRDLQERTVSHDRDHLNIAPRMYDQWLESVVATAADFDPEWTDETEASWRIVLGHIIDHMIRHY